MSARHAVLSFPAPAAPLPRDPEREAADAARADLRARKARDAQVAYAYELADVAVRGVLAAADRMGLDPFDLARKLQRGELADLCDYLAAASWHVPELTRARHRIDELLFKVTGRLLPLPSPRPRARRAGRTMQTP